MKRLLILLLCVATLSPFTPHLSLLRAQGWPSDYGGVMLQGFYWNSYADTKWTNLEAQAPELAASFDLIWVPQSGWCGNLTNMGYTPKYYWNQRSAFGTEAELRSMIQTFKSLGTGLIADVVINHREPTTGWFGYPVETYQGETYQMLSTDICRNDDGGKALTEANKQGVSLSSNNDTGEDWDGCRDLDHKSTNVQRIVKAYTRYLIDDLGYVGFRYDMVKGYSASYTAMYNTYAQPQFSVGEYWDSNANIKNWIRGTQGSDGKPTSAAFDFQFRYNVRDAINNNSWAYLKTDNRLIAENYFKPYAVTFVENHDMEYRSASAQQDPIRKDTLQANAFLMAMPGTPCVFLTHWQAYKQEIKLMIEARKLAGVTNTSSYTTKTSLTNYYAAEVTGHNTNLYVVVGKRGIVTSDNPAVGSDYQEIISGPGYRYLVAKKEGFDHAWLDKASGTYDAEVNVRAIALTTHGDARLVYTTDGTTPSADSPTIQSGETLHLTQSCTLTLGLLIGGRVVDTIQRTYDVTEFVPHTATIYCRPMVTLKNVWTTMNYYVWAGSDTPLNGSWPGREITETVEIDGQTWYSQSFDITSTRRSVNVVFSTASGSPQTVDVTGITDDAFFVIKNTKDAEGKYEVSDVTSNYTGIEDIEMETMRDGDNPQSSIFNSQFIYDLSGRRVSTNSQPSILNPQSKSPLRPGIYIMGKKKILVR